MVKLRHLLRQENGVTKRRPVRDDVVQRAFPQRKQDGDDVRAGPGGRGQHVRFD